MGRREYKIKERSKVATTIKVLSDQSYNKVVDKSDGALLRMITTSSNNQFGFMQGRPTTKAIHLGD